MKNILLKLLLLISIIFLPFLAQNIFACQCYGLPTPYKAFKGAKAVFVGRVVSVKDESGKEVVEKKVSDLPQDYEREDGERYYRFAVQEWFKGGKESKVTVFHNINMCEFAFDVGDEFLVYAYEYEGELVTSTFCSRTKNLENARKDDIHFLRELLKGIPEPKIYGTVQLEDKDPLTNSFRSKFLEGIKIVAQRGKRKFVTFTDKNGLYRFNKLPNGKYSVYPDLPNKYAEGGSWDRLFEINLQPDSNPYQYEYNKFSGTNAYSNIRLRWNNRISGKILDAEGKPLEKATVRLIPVDKINQISEKPLEDGEYYKQSLYPISRENNIRQYNIINNSPGKYILAIEIYAPFSNGKDRFRMYYPQTTDPKQAEVITVGEFGEQSFDVKLPDGYVVREITGSFLWGSGAVIESNGEVSLETSENSEDKENVIYETKNAKDVNFKFQVFENAEYWIHARAYQDKVKPVKVKVRKINPPINLRLFLLKNRNDLQ